MKPLKNMRWEILDEILDNHVKQPKPLIEVVSGAKEVDLYDVGLWKQV
jgi:hypothetical protein